MASQTDLSEISGPFGPAVLVEVVPAKLVEQMYHDKCGAEVGFTASGVDKLYLYHCETG